MLQTALSADRYTGAACATVRTDSYLYAAAFRTARIDVLKGNSRAPDLAATFTDPDLPPGYAPFNMVGRYTSPTR